jgi:hypothetical protein
MDEPDWAKILGYLHNHNGEIRRSAEEGSEGENEPSHGDHEQVLYEALRENVDIAGTDREDIVNTHKHLQNTGLVKVEKQANHAALKLTSKGFEVAHERELSKRDRVINRSLVFFTFILVVANIFDVAPIASEVQLLLSIVLLLAMLYAITRGRLIEI